VGISGVTGWLTEVDPAPLRAAEYALLEQAALILLLMYFPWIALPGPGDLRALWRGTPRSCVLFIGWKRLGRILLYGAVAPLAAYAACTRLAPFSSHRYGLWYTSTRVVLELTVVDTVMIGLLWVMTYKAVRQRAAEAGIAVPPPIGLRDRAAFAALAEALALAVIGYLALWEWVMPGDNRMLAVFVGIGLSEAIILLGAAWLMREAIFMFRRRKTFASFYLTLSRSGLGVLAAAAILVGALAGTALRHAEAANVAHLAGTAGTGLHNEVERTTARHTRAWFVDYHKRLRAGEGELERAIGQ